MEYFDSDENSCSEDGPDTLKSPAYLKLVTVTCQIYYDSGSHEIKTKLRLKTKDYEQTLKKTIQEIISIFYELQFEKFYIISDKMQDLIRLYEDEELNQEIFDARHDIILESLEEFFTEISNRDDILTSTKMKTFLKINELKYSSMLPPKFLLKIGSNLCSEELGVQDFDFSYANGIYIMALNATGAISNMGRIWSIMQKNV
jgi:hypothetical protein